MERGNGLGSKQLSVMRAMDAGESGGSGARLRFPVRAGPKLPPEERTVADLERKIGQLTLENDFQKSLAAFQGFHRQRNAARSQ